MEYKQPPGPPGPPPSAPPPYTANYGPAPTPVCKSINICTFKVNTVKLSDKELFGSCTIVY